MSVRTLARSARRKRLRASVRALAVPVEYDIDPRIFGQSAIRFGYRFFLSPIYWESVIFLSSEPARPERIRQWPHAWVLAVATVCFGAFMGQLDASIVTLTYRPVAEQFHAGLAGVEWVSLAYLLTLTALVIPVGRWSDRRGRKLSYLQGFIVFTVASAACGLAPSLVVLIGARVVQGAGAALLQSNSVALVTTSAPRDRMRTALGVQAAAQALGLALGPTVGGLLVDSAGWRYVYFINVPVGLVAVVAGIWLLPRTRHRLGRAPFDVAGTLLLAGSSTFFVLALSSLSGLHVPAWAIALLFAASAGTGSLLARRQRSIDHPLIDPALVGDRSVSVGLVGALFGYLTLFGPLVLVPIVLEAGGMSAVKAGLVLTFLPAGFAVAATLAGTALPTGWSNRARSIAGALMTSGAIAGGLFVSTDPTNLAVILFLSGLGLGTFTPANNAQVMGTIPPESSGTGGGMINMARGLGTTLGIATVTLCLQLAGSGSGHSKPALAALLGAALATLVCALSAPERQRSRGSTAWRADDLLRSDPVRQFHA
jgi:EmrB/QacA subfamily drug resistance transporter